MFSLSGGTAPHTPPSGRVGVPSPSAAGGGTPALPDRPNPATGRSSIIPISVSASSTGIGSWRRSKFITSFFNAATRSTRSASSARRKYANSASTSPFSKSLRRAMQRQLHLSHTTKNFSCSLFSIPPSKQRFQVALFHIQKYGHIRGLHIPSELCLEYSSYPPYSLIYMHPEFVQLECSYY